MSKTHGGLDWSSQQLTWSQDPNLWLTEVCHGYGSRGGIIFVSVPQWKSHVVFQSYLHHSLLWCARYSTGLEIASCSRIAGEEISETKSLLLRYFINLYTSWCRLNAWFEVLCACISFRPTPLKVVELLQGHLSSSAWKLFRPKGCRLRTLQVAKPEDKNRSRYFRPTSHLRRGASRRRAWHLWQYLRVCAPQTFATSEAGDCGLPTCEIHWDPFLNSSRLQQTRPPVTAIAAHHWSRTTTSEAEESQVGYSAPFFFAFENVSSPMEGRLQRAQTICES